MLMRPLSDQIRDYVQWVERTHNGGRQELFEDSGTSDYMEVRSPTSRFGSLAVAAALLVVVGITLSLVTFLTAGDGQEQDLATLSGSGPEEEQPVDWLARSTFCPDRPVEPIEPDQAEREDAGWPTFGELTAFFADTSWHRLDPQEPFPVSDLGYLGEPPYGFNATRMVELSLPASTADTVIMRAEEYNVAREAHESGIEVLLGVMDPSASGSTTLIAALVLDDGSAAVVGACVRPNLALRGSPDAAAVVELLSTGDSADAVALLRDAWADAPADSGPERWSMLPPGERSWWDAPPDAQARSHTVRVGVALPDGWRQDGARLCPVSPTAVGACLDLGSAVSPDSDGIVRWTTTIEAGEPVEFEHRSPSGQSVAFLTVPWAVAQSSFKVTNLPATPVGLDGNGAEAVVVPDQGTSSGDPAAVSPESWEAPPHTAVEDAQP
jgi:hypothetical protein